jgi:hypothetical protein
MRRVSREVRLVMVDECVVPVRLMTMGRMSTLVPGVAVSLVKLNASTNLF